MPLHSGDRVGRYEIAQMLGRGGMGEVYAAYDPLLQRRVALKMLTRDPGDIADSPRSGDAAARVFREARAAARITHPNAVAIYDVGEVGGAPFLAMELLSGRTLRAFIGDASVPIDRRVRWLIEVARGLGAAHALGLVHRDVKPDNVMVCDDGNVKVLDFGIARRTVPRGTVSADANVRVTPEEYATALGTLTAEGIIVGTPMYMAPEQMRGDVLDGRTDQFAWGVLAYELLTGKTPWSGTGVTLVSQILSRELDPMPGIPSHVDAVVRRALSRPVGDRFATMEEIAEELEAYAGAAGVATQRSPEGGAIPVSDPMALAATEHAASLPVGLGASAPRPDGEQIATRRSDRLRARIGGLALVGAIAAALVVGGLGGARLLSSWRPAPRAASPDAAAVAEAPSQMSSNAEAVAAYRSGMQLLRNASVTSAARQLDRAIELDPLFAAAHLRRALSSLVLGSPSTAFNEDLQSARNSRGSLGDHDRLLLDAFEPWTQVPPDLDESRRRLEAAVHAHPAESDFPFQLSVVFDAADQPAQAAEAVDMAIARDPTFALAWYGKGELRLLADDVAGGTAAYAECLRLSPGGVSCLSSLATLEANEGKCEEYLSMSRRLIELAPDSPVAYGLLAEALLGSDQPMEAVRAALEQKWERLPPTQRMSARASDEAALAIVRGDFVGADRRYEEFAAMVATDPNEESQFAAAYPRMLLDLEMGRPAAAARLAEQYMRRRSAWTTDDSGELLIRVYTIELAVGAIDRPRFNSLRDAWLARDRADTPGARWIYAYAFPAATPADADTALAAMPDGALVSEIELRAGAASAIGRTYLLAGKDDEAIRYLSRSSAACTTLQTGLAGTLAAFDLGGALEARGDAAGACVAYERVLARWGGARPASLTAEKALLRKRALRCPR